MSSPAKILNTSTSPTIRSLPKKHMSSNVITASTWSRMSPRQKTDLLVSKAMDPTVSIMTKVDTADGNDITEIAMSGVSARLLAAFSGYFKQQITAAKFQTIVVSGLKKQDMIKLVRWMIAACANTAIQSFEIANLDVEDLQNLWNAVTYLDIPLAKESICHEMDQYVMDCFPKEILDLVEYNLRLPQGQRIPGLKPIFFRYLNVSSLSDLLEFWEHLPADFERELTKPIRHALHQVVWTCNITLADLQTIWERDPLASFTVIAIKNVTNELWLDADKKTKQMPLLDGLDEELVSEIEKLWFHKKQVWQKRHDEFMRRQYPPSNRNNRNSAPW